MKMGIAVDWVQFADGGVPPWLLGLSCDEEIVSPVLSIVLIELIYSISACQFSETSARKFVVVVRKERKGLELDQELVKERNKSLTEGKGKGKSGVDFQFQVSFYHCDKMRPILEIGPPIPLTLLL